MAKGRPAPAPEPHEELRVEISELRTEVANLRAYVQVANAIFEEIREDLQWLTQNGIEIREPVGRLHPIPILKRMALDPAGEDWGEKLVIDFGIPSEHPELRSEQPLRAVAATQQPSAPNADSVSRTPEQVLPSSSITSPLPPPRPRDRLF